MNFHRLSPTFGAECLEPLTFDEPDLIRSALAQYGVLVFRNQVGFSGAKLKELAGLFGPLFHERTGKYTTVDGAVATTEHALEAGYVNAQAWHCDGIFSQVPFKAMALHLTELPECGGDTLFCSFDAVHASFSEPFRDFLRGLTVRYSLFPPVAPRRYLPIGKDPVDIPLVIRRDGKESIFFSPTSSHDIPQLTEGEASNLLAMLRQQVDLFPHQLRVRWAPGTVVVFDNTAVSHAVSLDYFPAVRKLTRVCALGTPLQAAANPAPGVPVLHMPLKKG